MSPEIKNEGLSQPQPLVDLVELQTRSMAGEQVDVWQEIHDALPTEMVMEALKSRHGISGYKSYLNHPTSVALNRRRAADKYFLELMDSSVPNAPDTESFAW